MKHISIATVMVLVLMLGANTAQAKNKRKIEKKYAKWEKSHKTGGDSTIAGVERYSTLEEGVLTQVSKWKDSLGNIQRTLVTIDRNSGDTTETQTTNSVVKTIVVKHKTVLLAPPPPPPATKKSTVADSMVFVMRETPTKWRVTFLRSDVLDQTKRPAHPAVPWLKAEAIFKQVPGVWKLVLSNTGTTAYGTAEELDLWRAIGSQSAFVK